MYLLYNVQNDSLHISAQNRVLNNSIARFICIFYKFHQIPHFNGLTAICGLRAAPLHGIHAFVKAFVRILIGSPQNRKKKHIWFPVVVYNRVQLSSRESEL